MITKYDVPMTIYPSRADASGRLSIPDCFGMFMDIAAPHAALLGCGTEDLAKEDLFWLTVKSKVKIIRRSYMMEKVVVSTWPRMPEEMRCIRDYSITQGDKTLVSGKTLWAVMNMKNGKLSRVDKLYPEGFEAFPEIAIEDPFLKFDRDFDTEIFATYQVRSTDIDFGGHMNNIAYIRALSGAFTVEEWNRMNLKEMEIHYKAPCFEGSILNLQRKTADGYTQICATLPNGKVVLYAAMK